MNNTFVSTEEKWKPVDNIIKGINYRRSQNKQGCVTELEYFIDRNFNRKNRNQPCNE